MICNYASNDVVDVIGLCNPDNITFDSAPPTPPIDRNWTEISIPEVLYIPPQKPDAESIDKVFIDVKIISKRVVPTAKTTSLTKTNEEGTKLTGRKLVIEGVLRQKIVYTALVAEQSVHSAHFNVPFSAFIVLPSGSLEEEFCVETCIEDVFVKIFNKRQIFKNVTLFLRAKPAPSFSGCP